MNYELGIRNVWKKLFLAVFLFFLLNFLFFIPFFAAAQSSAPSRSRFFYGAQNSFPEYGGIDSSFPRFGGINNTGRGGILISNPLAGVADDIPGLIGYILNTLKGIAVLIAVLMIVFGAYQILFSAGDPAGWKKGRQTIVYALIGLAIVLLANVFVSILREIVGSTY